MRLAFLVALVAIAVTTPLSAEPSPLDLTGATVVAPLGLTGPEEKAVQMLVEEVEERTTLRWERASSWPSGDGPVIAVTTTDRTKTLGAPSPPGPGGAEDGAAEGYRIRTGAGGDAAEVWVIGNDSRGLLFGIGHLLRKMEMRRGGVSVPEDLDVSSAPHYVLPRPPDLLSTQGELVRRVDRGHVGGLLPGPGGLRRQLVRAHPAAVGRSG